MANEDGLSTRAAGLQIAKAGLTDDVVRRDADDITKHRGRQRESDETERSEREPKQPKKRGDTREERRRDREDVEEKIDDESAVDYGDDEDGDSQSRDSEEDDHDAPDDDEDREELDEDADDDDTQDEDEPDRSDRDLDKQYKVKVNGKEITVPARELIAGYQRGRDYAEKTTALAERSRTLQAGHAEVAEIYKSQLNRAAYVVDNIKKMLVGDMDGPEMQQLKATDPQRWTYQRQLMQDRVGQVNRVLQDIFQQWERHEADYKASNKKQLGARAVQELELVLRAIPDWNIASDGQSKPAKVRLAEYLHSTGFTQAELDEVVDSRMLIVADKARRWDELQARRKLPVKKTAKPTPRVARPSGQSAVNRTERQPGESRAAREFQSAKKRAAKSGDMRDAGQAIGILLDRQARRAARNR